jgi:hypothetical protein
LLYISIYDVFHDRKKYFAFFLNEIYFSLLFYIYESTEFGFQDFPLVDRQENCSFSKGKRKKTAKYILQIPCCLHFSILNQKFYAVSLKFLRTKMKFLTAKKFIFTHEKFTYLRKEIYRYTGRILRIYNGTFKDLQQKIYSLSLNEIYIRHKNVEQKQIK